MRPGRAAKLPLAGKLLGRFVDRLRLHCDDGSFRSLLEDVEASHENRRAQL